MKTQIFIADKGKMYEHIRERILVGALLDDFRERIQYLMWNLGVLLVWVFHILCREKRSNVCTNT